MKDRSFADFMVGALACVSVMGFYALLRETETYASEQRRRNAARWALPRRRKRLETPEDNCRHCTGSGVCEDCAPVACRVCRGSGRAPLDAATVHRLTLLWDGAA